VSHGTIILSFFAIASLARYLATQLAAAESMLAAQREDLGRIEVLQQLVANAVDNGLVVTDANGRVISANPTAAEILGLPGGMSGPTLDTLLPGASALGVDAPPTELSLGEGSESHRQLRIKVGTVTDTFHHSIGRIYVIQDVTTVRELEARLREQEQLEAYADTVRTTSETAVTVFEGLVGESEPMRRVFSLDREGRAERLDRAHHGRERHRQGARRPCAAIAGASAPTASSCRSTAARFPTR
jgi:PAS domain-containing protein